MNFYLASVDYYLYPTILFFSSFRSPVLLLKDFLGNIILIPLEMIWDITLSARTVFHWKFQIIKFDLCLVCKIQATLWCSWFITVRSVKFDTLKIFNETGWSTSLQQSNSTFVCVVRLWPSRCYTGLLLYQVSNLICYIVKKTGWSQMYTHFTYVKFCKDGLWSIISNNQIWPLLVLYSAGPLDATPVQHCTNCQISFVEIVNKTGWSTI